MAVPSNNIFFILDLDRTLVKTDELFRLFREAVEENGSIPMESFDVGERKYQHTFDVVAYTRRLLDALFGKDEAEQRLGAIHQSFIQKARHEDLRESYARELIAELQEKEKAFGIITKGGQEWQQFKLEAAALEMIPHLITENARKAEVIHSWHGTEGFAIPEVLSLAPGILYDTVVLLDDKPVSFAGLHQGLIGILVRPLSGSTNESEDEKSAQGVTQVSGLKQARDLLYEYELL
jgi:hypothetical protein